MKKLFLFLPCCFLFFGCIHVQMASHNADVKAKTFEADSAKGNIYIVRTSRWWILDDYVYQTLLDGKVVGSLAPNTYQLLSVYPGKHIVAISLMGNVSQRTLEADWNTNYFFEIRPGFGGFTFEQVSEDQGRTIVLKAKRAYSSHPN
jgi:hypothetical protein